MISIDAARAEALFCSDLSCNRQPSADEVRAAIREQVRRHHGTRGCAADMAYEYGRHPDRAVARMAWARRAVEHAYHGGDVEWTAAVGVEAVAA